MKRATLIVLLALSAAACGGRDCEKTATGFEVQCGCPKNISTNPDLVVIFDVSAPGATCDVANAKCDAYCDSKPDAG